MNKVDPALLNILIKDGRASFADIARQLGISRAHARTRVQALVDSGVIELFSAVVNPEKLGKVISTFIDLKVAPAAMNAISQELADCPEVVSLYIMSDLQSLHIHTLTDSYESFDRFVRERIFNRPEVLAVDCKSLMTRVKNRRGGARPDSVPAAVRRRSPGVVLRTHGVWCAVVASDCRIPARNGRVCLRMLIAPI